MESFSEAFRSDPALAADLLLAANSAEFASTCEIDTIRHALTFLGLDRVRSLASSIALRMAMRAAHSKEQVRPVWAHAIATAVIAEELGTTHGSPGLYTAALVHDLGRLGLLLAAGAQYAETLAATFEDMDESNRLERKLFGIDHCQAGEMLGQTWHFPSGLRASMGDHHADAPAGARQKLIQMACLSADFLGFPEVQRRDLERTAPVWDKTGFSADDMRDKIASHAAVLHG